MFNPITLIDGYKLDHRRQYPPGTEYVYSNFTSRGSRVPHQRDVVFVGLQYFLQRYLMDEMEAFFAAPCEDVCARYAARVNAYLGPNAVGTEHIAKLHRLGYVPLEFRALAEGTRVPLRIPMLTVENTHADFAWLVNYYETLLSATLWMPCTSATTAVRMRERLHQHAVQTGTPPGFVPWQGHDFSMRGMPGVEAAQLSGFGHLCAFTGTDTIPAIDFVERYYPPRQVTMNRDVVPYCIGGSVAATEHSVMCAGGAANEYETIKRLLTEVYPEGIVSIVSDTWDLWHVLTDVLPRLKDVIMARKGKLVIRPDSGDPVKIICGDPGAEPGSPAHKGVAALLWDTFGGLPTVTGHDMLDTHVGVIYGDSINCERADAICLGLRDNNFASGNCVFGMGSYTYQYVTRDTHNFAMKATWVSILGEGRNIFKAPKTDDGVKNSAQGRLAVLRNAPEGDLVLVEDASLAQQGRSLLECVWRNGHFQRRTSIDYIRDLLASESLYHTFSG